MKSPLKRRGVCFYKNFHLERLIGEEKAEKRESRAAKGEGVIKEDSKWTFLSSLGL